MSKKKPQAVKQDSEERVWQVVKERIGLSGAVINRQNLGMPQTLQNAKQIFAYRNTIERRSDIKYRIEHIDDNY